MPSFASTKGQDLWTVKTLNNVWHEWLVDRVLPSTQTMAGQFILSEWRLLLRLLFGPIDTHKNIQLFLIFHLKVGAFPFLFLLFNFLSAIYLRSIKLNQNIFDDFYHRSHGTSIWSNNILIYIKFSCVTYPPREKILRYSLVLMHIVGLFNAEISLSSGSYSASELFYAKRLRICIHCTFILIFLCCCFLSVFFSISYMISSISIKYK